MADSDDEYDRKRRDKFRGERTESYSRERREDRRRDDWVDRYLHRYVYTFAALDLGKYKFLFISNAETNTIVDLEHKIRKK